MRMKNYEIVIAGVRRILPFVKIDDELAYASFVVISDSELVSRLFRERMPNIPTVFTLAPVCRPTWLVEMECIAVTKNGNASFRNF